jgi:hypothetical protein
MRDVILRGHRGHAVPVPADHTLRDRLRGLGYGHRRRAADPRRRGSRSARPLVGDARLVEHGLGVGLATPRRRNTSACPRSAVARRTAPPIGIGYIQPAGRPLTELRAVTARESFSDNGLPLSTTLTLNPGALEVVANIRGHAPLRLVAPDGHVAQFPRAWATVSASDGRRGAGSIEWNRHAAR